MKKLGLKGKTAKKIRKYSSYRGTVGKVADNILDRKFDVRTPNTVFVTDVAEFAFDWGKVYLSPVMDLCNRQIIGYGISGRPNFDQIKNMMSSASEGRKIVDGALFPQRPGMAVSDEGVPGNAFRPGTEAVDVKEGKLP